MEGFYGEALLGALSKVNFPQINRFTPEAFDWLFEQEKESVDLLKWLTKTLSADTHLSEDQLESYNQIPFSERLTGGKVLEEALESLQDKDSNISNEEIERKIAELESELGYYNENCEVMGALKCQLTDSERLSSVELNQLHEQVEKVRRDNRKGQESVLEMNTDFNASLKKLENSLQEFKSKYESTSSRLSQDKVHAFQIDLDQISTKETELNQAIGSFITTVFGSKFNNLGIFQTQAASQDDEKPKIMDLESKDLLELVRGRDRTEFQHLKSEIYRIRVCLYKSEMDRIDELSRNAGLLAALESLNQSLRLNRNTVLVPISTGERNNFEEISSCLKRNADDKENIAISDLISRCISYYCQRVLITDYNIKYRRSAYMFKKLHSIRDELIQSRAREQLLDLTLAQEADHIKSITNSFKNTQQLLDERYRKRQGFKSAVESLDVSGNANSGDCVDTKPGMVIKPDDFIFTNLHKLLRFKEHVDAVPTYAGVEQAVAPLIHLKYQIQEEMRNNKENRLETVHNVEAGMRRLFSLLHIDQFSPSRGISLIPKEVNRAISTVDKDIHHLEMKLKAILTEWEQAKSDIKTRPYRRNQRQLWIDFLLKPELVPANVRAVENRAK